jgi:hypothetical protein
MEGLFIVVFIAIVAAVIIGGYFSYQAQQRRVAELSQFAAARGWQFDSSNDYSHDERYGYFSLFSTGDDRYAYNTIRGALDVEGRTLGVQMGDYHYETTSRSTDSKGHTTTTTHHHQLSYLILETPHGEMPALFIRREGFFDKIAGFLGFDDIDLESAEFSDRFKVKSPDKRFAYDVLHPRMMEFLLDGEPPTIDLQHAHCCLTRGEKCWSVAEFEATLAWASRFFAQWPRHLTAQTS